MDEKKWNDLVKRVAQRLYDGKQKSIIDSEMVRQTAEELMQAITVGIGYDFGNADTEQKYGSLARLRENVFHFSGAKNYNQLKEMSALLMSGDKKTPFKEFLKGVQTIDKTYNQTYLQAEYNHAVTSAQMIGKWKQFEAEAKIFPNLRWVAEMSNRTCPICAPLNDITLPFNHPFWRQNFVPRHFQCNCNIIQEDGDVHLTDDSKLQNLPSIAPMFKQNVGITGIVYSAKHPYFTSIPSDVLKQVVDESGALIVGQIKPERLKVLAMDRAEQFEKVSGVLIHKLVNRSKKSYFNEFAEALERVKTGSEVEMLPELHEQEKAFRSKVFPKFDKPDVHPDYRFDKTKYVELENATGNSRNNIKHAIQVGAKQADYVIVKSAGSITLQDMHRAAGSAFKDYQNLQEIEIIQGGERIVIKRKKPNQK